MPLSPELQQYLEAKRASGAPEVWQAPVAELRAASYAKKATAGPLTEIFSIEDRYIPGPTSDLHIRIYRPDDRMVQPGLVYFHGGGWVLNFLDIYDAELTSLAKKSGSTVIAVHYQKAPEHPYPTPFDDCFATYLWAVSNAQSIGLDANKIGVGGESAGGNLAAAVALKARDRAVQIPAYQLLINPCMERKFDTESYEKYAMGYGLSRKGMQWYWDQYLQDSEHDQDPYASPPSAKDFTGLPPAIIVTAEFDPLRDDAANYDWLLRGAGVATFYKEYAGMIHGFTSLGGVTPTADVALKDCAKIIQELIR